MYFLKSYLFLTWSTNARSLCKTTVCHLSLTRANFIQSTPSHPMLKIHFNLTPQSSSSSTYSLYVSLTHQSSEVPFSTIRATCPAHFILLALITRMPFADSTVHEASDHSFLQSPVTPPSPQNTPHHPTPSTPLSNTLPIFLPQDDMPNSHPHIMGKITVLWSNDCVYK